MYKWINIFKRVLSCHDEECDWNVSNVEQVLIIEQFF